MHRQGSRCGEYVPGDHLWAIVWDEDTNTIARHVRITLESSGAGFERWKSRSDLTDSRDAGERLGEW